ncbi:MAG: hypothetical protein K0R67_3793, partial [Paenibacillus sp.]|nr:hypothetical protein [Paenibacillus sp.]
MRKRLKQLSALSLAAVLVLSACGTKTEEQGTDSPKTSTGPTSSSAPQREKLTLNFMTTVPTNTSSLPSGDKDFIRKTLEEKFNVELKMDYSVLGEEFSTKLNLKLTAGDAPDLFHAEGA